MITTFLYLILQMNCPPPDYIEVRIAGKVRKDLNYDWLVKPILERKQEEKRRCVKYAIFHPDKLHMRIVWRAKD